MSKPFGKIVLYGLLLVAGIALGMQMSSPASLDSQGAGATPGAQSGSGLQPVNPVATEPIKEVYTVITPDGKKGYLMVPEQQTDFVRGQADAQMPSAAEQNVEALQTPADLLLPEPQPPVVDRFADKTASLLQRLSSRSIQWVSSWFDSEE